MAAFSRDTLNQVGLLILRLTVGLQLALLHGLDKLQHFSERAGGFSNPIGIGSKPSYIATIAAELGCGLLLALGLGSRLCALAIAFTMGVAGFLHHAADPWKRKELALLYFGAALALLFLGPGRLSLDALFSRGRGGAAGPRAAFKR